MTGIRMTVLDLEYLLCSVLFCSGLLDASGKAIRNIVYCAFLLIAVFQVPLHCRT